MARSMENCLYKLAPALLVTAALVSGCADRQRSQNETNSQPEQTTTGRRERQAARERRLVTEKVAAPIDSPWRNAGKWQEMHASIYFSPDNLWEWAPQRYRLAQLARQLPDRIERAEVHLRLARIGANHSLWARQNVLQSQRLLAELIARVPSSPGLLKAVVDANRSYHWYRVAHQSSHRCFRGAVLRAQGRRVGVQ
ncbi:MAG: hypothetical protein KY475_03875 [Planctomycetes bacterium]|nr:hypothetical protein [Planctomycetota bacterium]